MERPSAVAAFDDRVQPKHRVGGELKEKAGVIWMWSESSESAREESSKERRERGRNAGQVRHLRAPLQLPLEAWIG